MKFAKVMFLHLSVSHSVHRGGGMCGRGACVAGGLFMVGGHAWQGGMCCGGMHGGRAYMAVGHAWQGGVHGRGHEWLGSVHGRGACMAGGMHGGGACIAVGNA